MDLIHWRATVYWLDYISHLQYIDVLSRLPSWPGVCFEGHVVLWSPFNWSRQGEGIGLQTRERHWRDDREMWYRCGQHALDRPNPVCTQSDMLYIFQNEKLKDRFVWELNKTTSFITIFVNLGLFWHFEIVTNIRTWIKSHRYWRML